MASATSWASLHGANTSRRRREVLCKLSGTECQLCLRPLASGTRQPSARSRLQAVQQKRRTPRRCAPGGVLMQRRLITNPHSANVTPAVLIDDPASLIPTLTCVAGRGGRHAAQYRAADYGGAYPSTASRSGTAGRGAAGAAGAWGRLRLGAAHHQQVGGSNEGKQPNRCHGQLSRGFHGDPLWCFQFVSMASDCGAFCTKR